ncbi:hypothetical protein HK096_002137, partial [Nowakowskiella sp. JEL0078]
MVFYDSWFDDWVAGANLVPFDAVSHVWGAVISREFSDGRPALADTQAKIAKLESLSFKGGKPLWVDIRHVEQTKMDLKAAHIKVMHKVYGSASRTYVLLSNSDMNKLKQMVSVIMSVGNQMKIAMETGGLREIIRCGPDFERKLSKAANEWGRSEYMSRVWTMQERFLSNRIIYTTVDTVDGGSDCDSNVIMREFMLASMALLTDDWWPKLNKVACIFLWCNSVANLFSLQQCWYYEQISCTLLPGTNKTSYNMPASQRDSIRHRICNELDVNVDELPGQSELDSPSKYYREWCAAYQILAGRRYCASYGHPFIEVFSQYHVCLMQEGKATYSRGNWDRLDPSQWCWTVWARPDGLGLDLLYGELILPRQEYVSTTDRRLCDEWGQPVISPRLFSQLSQRCCQLVLSGNVRLGKVMIINDDLNVYLSRDEVRSKMQRDGRLLPALMPVYGIEKSMIYVDQMEVSRTHGGIMHIVEFFDVETDEVIGGVILSRGESIAVMRGLENSTLYAIVWDRANLMICTLNEETGLYHRVASAANLTSSSFGVASQKEEVVIAGT